MRSELEGGFELDDDRARLDVTAIHAFIAAESYGDNQGRSREEIETMIDGSWRTLGLYLDGSQVGFGRAISDGLTFAYLADVYVLPDYRRRGLGKALVRELVEGGAGSRMRWLLHTADAVDFYENAGFSELLRPRYRMGHVVYAPRSYPVMERGPTA
jgi:GNAT superfamily N-acetyltransferase